MLGGVIRMLSNLNVPAVCGSLGFHINAQTGSRKFCCATHTNTELNRKGQLLQLIPCASFSSNLVLCCRLCPGRDYQQGQRASSAVPT